MSQLELRALQQRRVWLIKKRRWQEANTLLKRLQRIIQGELARK